VSNEWDKKLFSPGECRFFTSPGDEILSDPESQWLGIAVDNGFWVLLSASRCGENSQRETADNEGWLFVTAKSACGERCGEKLKNTFLWGMYFFLLSFVDFRCRSVYLALCFTPLFSLRPCHYIPLPKLRPLIFGLTPFGWLRTIALASAYYIIPYGDIFRLRLFYLRPPFFRWYG